MIDVLDKAEFALGPGSRLVLLRRTESDKRNGQEREFTAAIEKWDTKDRRPVRLTVGHGDSLEDAIENVLSNILLFS